jgi:uncharacterized protein (TIGR02246 family)
MSRAPKVIHLSPDDTEHAFYEALEAGDLDALMALWADDEHSVCVHPGGPRLIGHDAIRDSWKEVFANGRLQIRPADIRSVDGIMIAVHNLVQQVVISGHQEAQDLIHILATNVYIKGPTGWKMMMHHASHAHQADETSHMSPEPLPTLH